MNELKISKTGKHGSSKANMVGYDLITNRKYQETVPGHATMFGFEPRKVVHTHSDFSAIFFSFSVLISVSPDGFEI